MDPCANWGYSNYTNSSIGCDRTSVPGSAGSGYAAQYCDAHNDWPVFSPEHTEFPLIVA